ncbi:hypothetical protein CRUP_007014, partial [Coryphaenoides rupestris]
VKRQPPESRNTLCTLQSYCYMLHRMHWAALLLSALSVTWAKPRLPLLSQQMIDVINKSNTTWKAGQNFDNVDKSLVNSLCGTLLNGPRLPEVMHSVEDLRLPPSFDPRQEWPNCPTIGQIRDQGGYRLCIQTQGEVSVEISAEDLLTCCNECGMGEAWYFWMTQGVVTGGSYNSNCATQCIDGYSVPYPEDKHMGKRVYGVPSKPEQIMAELYINGPVEAVFYVLGWGEENGTPYWLVANSWNTDWGDE